jgi:hypothetical protein
MPLPLASPLRAAGRKHPELLEEIVTPGGAARVAYDIIRNGSDIKFTAAIVHNDGTADVVYPIADTRGKRKVFGDLDQVVRQVTTIYGSVTSLVMTASNAAVMNPVETVPSDPFSPIRREKAFLEKQLPIAALEATKSQLALTQGAPFENGTLAQQARFAELTAMKNATMEYVAFLTDEIARLGALLPPA